MKSDLYVVGIGPGSSGLLTKDAERAIADAGCVVAAPRHAALAGAHKNVVQLRDFAETFETIDEELNKWPVAVMVSGDPGIFSLLPLLKKRFPSVNIKVIPGISALQSICAEAGESWNDAKILSGHGRPVKDSTVLREIDRNAKIVFFCGAAKNPKWLCSLLSENDMNNVEVTVGERLSYSDQRVTRGTPDELSGLAFDPMSIIFIKNPSPWNAPCGRPKDEDFIRSKVPMTKYEIRSIILDKLELEDDAVLWDIGAGTGSIAVAAALLYPELEVHAVECVPEAVELEKKNKKKFHLFNLAVHQGRCPEAMKALPAPTHVFVGGSGGELSGILDEIMSLCGRVRIVLSCVTLQSLALTAKAMGSPLFSDVEAVQVIVCKGKQLGGSSIMSAQNPITIFSAWLNGKKECDAE